VHLLIRRDDIPRINKGKGAGSPGFVHGHALLPDDWKWRIRHYIHQQQVPPPRNSTLRVSRHPNAFFHLGCAVQGGAKNTARCGWTLARARSRWTSLIVATGFASRLDAAAHAAPHRAARAAVEAPLPAAAGAARRRAVGVARPGPGLRVPARADGACPGLDRVHCFCYPAALSLGVITGDIPAISDGALQLAASLAGLLYAEDIGLHFERMQAFDEPEVFGDEWTASPLPPYQP
jgi:cation diffusion facilitator CzcD-associated flavoprotein CzcO